MIVIDDREVRCGICDELKKLDVEFEVCRLKIGDYIINTKIYIERKTVSDFLESIYDNRLFNQIYNLRKNNKRAILIIEGKHLPGKASVRGVLCSLASRWYTPYLRSADLQGTAWILQHLQQYEQYEKPSFCVYDYRKKRSVSTMEEKMLMQMRSVGPETARKLLRKFGSINALINAPDEEILKIENVGKIILAQIKILRGIDVS